MKHDLDLISKIYKDAEMSEYTLIDVLQKLEGKKNKIKGTIEEILNGYKKFLNEAKDILLKHDASLEEQGFFAKMGANMGIIKDILHDNSDAGIADMVINGISMGIDDIKKQYEIEKDDLDNVHSSLANDFITFQKKSIQDLKEYL